MTIREQVESDLEQAGSQGLFVDGHDESIIGLSYRFGGPALVSYDTRKIINTLMTRDNMTEDEAYEYFEFNISGAWVGKLTPIFIDVFEN